MLSFETILFDEADETKNTFINIKCVWFVFLCFENALMPCVHSCRGSTSADRYPTTNTDNPSTIRYLTSIAPNKQTNTLTITHRKICKQNKN